MHPSRVLPCLVCLALLQAFSGFWQSNWASPDPNPDDPTTVASTDRPQYVPGRILFRLSQRAVQDPGFRISVDANGARTRLASLDRLAQEIGASNLKRAYIDVSNKALDEQLGVSRWHLLEFDATIPAPSVRERWELDPHVEVATLDYFFYPSAIPNDPKYPLQWGHNNTAQLPSVVCTPGCSHSGPTVGTAGFDSNAQDAWDKSPGYGTSNVIIAIIDTGVEAGRPDLLQVAGYDFGDSDSDPDDDCPDVRGHGTSCAGVAAARANNGVGVAGIAGGCSIMPLKICNSAGSSPGSAIQNALYYAADNGAHVASMSFGTSSPPDPATETALSYAFTSGVTLLAATGNQNASTIHFPASSEYVIAVGAASPCGDRKRSSSDPLEVGPGVFTDPNGYTCDGERRWGANYGSFTPNAPDAVDLIAPTILPTTDLLGADGYDPSNYFDWFNGTSCSTPYAAGVAALVLSVDPSLTPTEVREVLRDSAIDITSVESVEGWDRYTGYGMVNAEAAIGAVEWIDQSGSLALAGANGTGVAWGDYDNDGDLDLFHTTHPGTNRLFRREGNTWVDATSGALVDSVGQGTGAAWGDYDSDGDLDLYLAKTAATVPSPAAANKLYRNDAGTWVDATTPLLADQGDGQSVSWVDYDNDGDLDLYLTNRTTANALFRNDGLTSWSLVPGPQSTAMSSQGVAWADFDDDGDADLYLANDGPNKMFRNDGGGTFADVTSSPLDNTGNGYGVDTGDYDNDGDLDLYLVNDAGLNQLFRNDGGGTWTSVTIGQIADAGFGASAAWGDYDNDGDLDLYLVKPDRPNRLYRNTGVDWENDRGHIQDTGDGRGAAWGDYDNDGYLDLFLANFGVESNRLFRNGRLQTNHWIHVDLRGVASNTFGIGARIRVVTGGVSQIREVSGGSGYCSQNSLTAEFGLGAATMIDSIIVRWPSGNIQSLANVPVDQKIGIDEDPAPASAETIGTPTQYRLHPAQPNPAIHATTIRFDLPTEEMVSLRVFDVSGRLVRVLEHSQREAGRHAIEWDGHGDNGERVTAGVYFYRIEAGSFRTSQRLLRLQ